MARAKQRKTFRVVEYSSYFAIVHIKSGEEHPLSDGVDMLFDEDGHAMSPGDPAFVSTLEECFNADVGETLEAYFPHLAEF
jgi:hypothetical protein